jgi:hypothetical protein
MSRDIWTPEVFLHLISQRLGAVETCSAYFRQEVQAFLCEEERSGISSAELDAIQEIAVATLKVRPGARIDIGKVRTDILASEDDIRSMPALVQLSEILAR